MALRIKGSSAVPPVEEELPVEEAVEEMPVEEEMSEEVPAEEPSMEPEMGGGTLDPELAGYLGPEEGPFMCANCAFFSPAGPNTCEHVSGYIDEQGCCNLFTSAGMQEEEPVEESVEEAPIEEETPVEEPVEEPTEEY